MSDNGHNEPQTMSDEEFFAARRETMGPDYPGDDEMRRRDAEDDAVMNRWAEQQRYEPAPATAADEQPSSSAKPSEWDAHKWVEEAFKDDPNFGQLSAEDRGRLETMAEEKHAAFQADVQEWAHGRADEWSNDLHDKVVEGLDANASTRDFVETRLADGDFSADDQAALKQAVEHMTPAEQMHLVKPIVEEVRQIDADVIDGVEMIVGHAVHDVKDIVDARAEMPGGDSPEMHKMQEDLEAAPDQVHEALDFLRHDHDAQFDKVEARMEAIEGGADPRSLHDPDEYQVDDNAHEHAAAEA